MTIGELAQLVRALPIKVEVNGSSPLISKALQKLKLKLKSKGLSGKVERINSLKVVRGKIASQYPRNRNVLSKFCLIVFSESL